MLRKATEMMGYNIAATDGEIGHVEDFYFDITEIGDTEWAVRYMVVDTGFWIFGRKVLIAPDVLGTPEWESGTMPVELTKEHIENSPELDMERPITREYERNLRGYYGWPIYWGVPPATPTADSGFSRDTHMAPTVEAGGRFTGEREEVPDEVAAALREGHDRHIYSVDDLTGFRIHAQDGEFGSVKDVFIDDYNWMIRYLLIDTGTWMPGREVLIAPQWVEQLNLDDSELKVTMTQEQIENSPEYESGGPLDRDYEGRLYNYYGYRTYW